ncbi:MAG TPA: carboxylating nicotinate-nucleotide diphosphorylase [Dehalococcoidia bacterium]|nr:carboxylating nicotinate-nucleotide diphosphorylase [Dehalococcoidia bacterium]MDP6273215.1 carboxylating nicotinate-nucleotide diphosphorylase [Dehalococcoidia bacterium]MDP7161022.1 carboxylating nicotinate-nucleotide diphosphorylase [Dehalococcoidia bacterium]MDP7212978.1 carboxylating nicotinate-nucleotide diphosphorylase [Dehalococcoidia bacterium]MDP7514776.1 carboxylating nicotinate-nucleotide diphosphorylase [Dehalococcoidia bacterium]
MGRFWDQAGELPYAALDDVIDRALREDLSLGDATTDVLIPPRLLGAANLVARSTGVLAGVDAACEVFRRVDDSIKAEPLVKDSLRLEPDQAIARISGSMAGILKAERTALNLLQRMSGIATMTAELVDAVKGTNARIIDTRKTAPGLRALDKYAVTAGGGANHRFNLGDLVLIKDNHLETLAGEGLGIADVVRRARSNARHNLRIEVEVETVEQAGEALSGGADIILLDNMSPDQMSRAVKLVDGRALTEASGDISMATVRAAAESGVDLISVGALTHSVKALNIALDYESR